MKWIIISSYLSLGIILAALSYAYNIKSHRKVYGRFDEPHIDPFRAVVVTLFWPLFLTIGIVEAFFTK